jgi:hypothetical protein
MQRSAARQLKTRFFDALASGRNGSRAVRSYGAGSGAVFVGISVSPSGEHGLAVRVGTALALQEKPFQKALGRIDGPVEVRVVGAVRALTSGTAPVKTMLPGASVGHERVTAGTLGCFVRVSDSNDLVLMSNNHVLADTNRGTTGDVILSPAAADGGGTGDRVGRLLRYVALDPGGGNKVDVALATVDDTQRIGGNDVGAGLLTGVVAAENLDAFPVAKVGRTTGKTTGRITAIEVDGVAVGYDGGTSVFSFDGCIEVEGDHDLAFSSGGDSGSVIYRVSDRAAAALLFAGSETGGQNGTGVTYANPMVSALASVDADLLL